MPGRQLWEKWWKANVENIFWIYFSRGHVGGGDGGVKMPGSNFKIW